MTDLCVMYLADPVYVMWKDTPYARIMVKVSADG